VTNVGSTASNLKGDHDQTDLVGRDSELARLVSTIDGTRNSSRVLVVLGEAGIGKTVLLQRAAERARSLGMRVLWTTGRESESNLPFAVLYQLLNPLLDSVPDLSERQSSALLGALGLAEGPKEADQLLARIAALTLLSDVAERTPLLLVADDVHWIDQSSLELLTFVGHRLDSEQVILLFGARTGWVRSGRERTFSELKLEPLDTNDANLLLDAQKNPPQGYARAQVISQAAGNPMALIELARAISADPTAVRRWANEPMPVGGRLTSLITTQVTSLPEATQAALLYAAVADSSNPPGNQPLIGISFDPEVIQPAEALGLVTLSAHELTFSHPLVCSAVYHSAPFARRAAAHRLFADAIQDEPDRRAWHLAAAAIEPDDVVASLLEETATHAQHRGGAVAAAMAMQRAGELTSDPDEKARRFVAAATIAIPSGQIDWVRELANRALGATVDRGLQLQARASVGWALAWSAEQTAALSTLLSVASEAAGHQLVLAWEALEFAATVQAQIGGRSEREAVRKVLKLLEEVDVESVDAIERRHIAAHRLHVRVWTGSGPRVALLADLSQISQEPMDYAVMQSMAVAAFGLDETELAIHLYKGLLDQLEDPNVRGSSGPTLSALARVLTDAGHWDDALTAAGEAEQLASAYKMDLAASSADFTVATILALRGDAAESRGRVEMGLAKLDADHIRSAFVRANRALGLAALAEQSYLGAFIQLSTVFDAEGVPVHPYWSLPSIADLADAARRAGRQLEGRRMLDRILSLAEDEISPRIAQLIARAHGALSDRPDAGERFESALSDPAGDQWPYDRALLRLGYGEWLRREKRKREAKENLSLALETFERLGARPAASRTTVELRACGVNIQTYRDTLSDLTSQERQIVLLAAKGLTNREIGDRLYISPRTVSSHLYHSYPKLGVSSRRELREVLGEVDF